MSLIFEALRRSESERTGHSLSESTARELLRAAENDVVAEAREEKIQDKLLVPLQTGAEAIRQESDLNEIASFESVITEQPEAGQSSFGNADPDWVDRAGSAESKEESIASLPQGQAMRPSASPDSRLVCLSQEWSLAAEKFRVLGLRLRQCSQKRPLKNVLVTSTVAGEGKSFVCANLAITMSRKKGQRVLLIDGDLRRPVLTERFGLGQLSGLSECLKNGIPVSKGIYHLQEFGFWFLPSGNQSDNALELMQSGHLPEMLAELGRSFDWIIIDSPPLIPLADTAFWSRLAHGTLLVARQGRSERRALQRGVEMLDRSSILGVVLNASSSADHKSYYQRYGYGAPPSQNRTAS
jgi:capsular exopolysaccharide synthesis family protein